MVNKFILFLFLFSTAFASTEIMSFPAYDYLKSVVVIIVFLAILFVLLKFITKVKLGNTVLPSFDIAVVGKVTVESGLSLYVLKIKDRYKLISCGSKSISVIDDISDSLIMKDENNKIDFSVTLDKFIKKRNKKINDTENS